MFIESHPFIRPSIRTDRQKQLLIELHAIRKRYGDEAVIVYGNDENHDTQPCSIEVLSTGILPVDQATRIGGIPRGRITEIFGPPSSGKTTLALHVIAETQKKGGIAAFIAMEHPLDAGYAHQLGICTDELLVSQPDSGEESLEILIALVCSGAIDVIIVDSVAAIVPQVELLGNMGDYYPAAQATLLSRALKKLVGISRKSRTAVIFINQLLVQYGGIETLETTRAGNALKFYASLRIATQTMRTLVNKDVAYADEVRITVVKNNVGESCGEEICILCYDPSKTVAANVLEASIRLGVASTAHNINTQGENI